MRRELLHLLEKAKCILLLLFLRFIIVRIMILLKGSIALGVLVIAHIAMVEITLYFVLEFSDSKKGPFIRILRLTFLLCNGIRGVHAHYRPTFLIFFHGVRRLLVTIFA